MKVPGWAPVEAPGAVLLVSADAEFRSVALRVLRRAGYAAEGAPHGGHALLACMHQRFDVILVDTNAIDGNPRFVAGLLRNTPARIVPIADRPASAEDLLACLDATCPSVL